MKTENMNQGNLLISTIFFATILTACKKDKTTATSAGDSWNNIATVQGGLPSRIEFPSENVGYMCGSDHGFMAKTVNGGVTWNALPDPENSGIFGMYALCFLNDSTGYVGINGTGGRIYKTTNGGQSWKVSCPTAIGVEGVTLVNDIHFTDVMHGIATTRYGRILRTADGGETWNFATIDHYFNLVDYYGISFADQNTGYVVGTLSTLLKTTDGGATWITLNNYNTTTTVSTLNGGQLYDVHAFNSDNILISSRTGGLFRTSNGGTSWTKISNIYCSRIGFDSPTHGFTSVESNNTPFVNFLETSDAGFTWQNVTIPNLTIIFRDFVMVKPGVGFGINDHLVYKYKK